MSKILIYHKNAEFRGKIEACLAQHSFTIVPCYSAAKLDFYLNKMAQNGEPFILLAEETHSDELTRRRIAHISLSEETTSAEIIGKINALNIRSAGIKVQSFVENDMERYDLIVIGSSTGGLPVAKSILKKMQVKNTIVIMCQHIDAENTKVILPTLSDSKGRKAILIDASTKLDLGNIYLLHGGSDYILNERYGSIYVNHIGLTSEFYHPSINSLLSSVDSVANKKIAIVILSGLGSDGKQAISQQKLFNVDLIVQDPGDAIAPGMPQSVIDTGKATSIFKAKTLPDYLKDKVA